MLGVHLESGRVSVEKQETPYRPPGFALIRMLVAGICNTDLELQRGYYGFAGTPGHEFAGTVVEADTPSLAGRRVVGEINLACDHCEYCARDLGRHCPHRTVLGIVKHPGAFAEYLVLPERNLHMVPDQMPDHVAVFVEPLAAAGEILEQVDIPKSSNVAVLGDGKLGLLIAHVLHAHGARITLFGHHRSKLAIAKRAGIQTSASRDHPRAAFDFVVDATGSPAGIAEAVKMVRPRGTVIMKSTMHGEVSLDTAPVIVNEITLVGSRCGRFEPALELLASGKIDVSNLISAEFPLEEAVAAFREAARPGALKVLLRNQARAS